MTEVGKGLIAIPHTGMVCAKFMCSFCGMMTTFPAIGNPDLFWITEHYTHVAREEAARKCLDEGYDWLLFVDSDATFERDALSKLLAHNLPIVAGLSFKRTWPPLATMYAATDGTLTNFRTMMTWKPLQEVDATGCHCMLLRREVFEKLERPWFALNEAGRAEDISFCLKARKAGFRIFVDTTVKTGHVGPYEFTVADYERAIQVGAVREGTVSP